MNFVTFSGRAAAVGQATTAWLTAQAGQTTLTGASGNDMFFGGQNSLLVGGTGDDTYYLTAKGDRALELAGEGVDTIVAWGSISLNSYSNIENLRVGSDGNYAVGNAADNVIEGLEGRQQIYGGLGEDVLAGGAGNDVFIVRKGEGNDVIQDFASGQDKVRLDAGFTSFSALQSHISQSGADTLIDLGGGDGLILRGVTASQLSASDFLLPLDIGSLGGVTFADEFNSSLSLYDSVHATGGVWSPDFGYQGANGVGSYTLVSNGEKQIYTSPYFRDHNGDFSESPFVMNPDGTLSIWAKPSSNAEIFGYGYTSGALTTANSFAQQYGYFEIRADVPTAAGAWPAFWLVPNDGSWPPELDVMETLSGAPDVAHTTAHTAASGSHTAVTLENYVVPTADGMHTYGALWTPSELIYYIDRVEVFRTATPADMNKPMHMIVNMALGGWAGDIDASAMPAEFKIDYVRAYSLSGGASTVTLNKVGAPAAVVEPTPVAPPPVVEPTPVAPPLVVEPAPVAPPVAVAPPPVVLTPPAAAMPPAAGSHIITHATAADGGLFILPTSGEATNWIHGADAMDVLVGGGGNDFIDGKAGEDHMTGGAGDDTYAVDHGFESIVEKAGGGVDTVLSTAWGYTLGDNVENIRLIGYGDTQIAKGNALGNMMVGGWITAVMDGGAGDDILVAGTRGNVLTGGEGKDIFQFDSTPNDASRITDFQNGQDLIDLRGLFARSGYSGSDPFADHHLMLQADGAGGTNIYFDADGDGGQVALLVTNVTGTDPSVLDLHTTGHNDVWLM